MKIKLSTEDWYQIILTSLTILMIMTYGYVYFISSKKHGQKYIPLIVTTRILILAFFLIYFYNPLRSTYAYGHAMPIIAFSAGISLLLLLNRFDILNLVHFMLYGDLLPENPKKVCRLENDHGEAVDVSTKVQ